MEVEVARRLEERERERAREEARREGEKHVIEEENQQEESISVSRRDVDFDGELKKRLEELEQKL